MNKEQIKEKLAFYRVVMSFNLLAIFGIIGWVYQIPVHGNEVKRIIAVTTLLLISLLLSFVIKKMNILIKKL